MHLSALGVCVCGGGKRARSPCAASLCEACVCPGLGLDRLLRWGATSRAVQHFIQRGCEARCVALHGVCVCARCLRTAPPVSPLCEIGRWCSTLTHADTVQQTTAPSVRPVRHTPGHGLEAGGSPPDPAPPPPPTPLSDTGAVAARRVSGSCTWGDTPRPGFLSRIWGRQEGSSSRSGPGDTCGGVSRRYAVSGHVGRGPHGTSLAIAASPINASERGRGHVRHTRQVHRRG